MALPLEIFDQKQQMKDLNIGIIGYGRLGKLMYKYCKAFEANVSVYDPYIEGFDNTKLDEFVENCDVISLHVHLNDETRYMINKSSLGDFLTDNIRPKSTLDFFIVLDIKSQYKFIDFLESSFPGIG